MNDPFNPEPADTTPFAPNDAPSGAATPGGEGTPEAAAAFHALAAELDASAAHGTSVPPAQQHPEPDLTDRIGSVGATDATTRADKVAPVLVTSAAKPTAAERKAAKQAAKNAAKAAKANALPTTATSGGLTGAPVENAKAAKKAVKTAKKEAQLAAAGAAASGKEKNAQPTRPGPWVDPAKPSALLLPSYIVDRHAAAKTARAMKTITIAVVVLLVLASAFFFWTGQQAAKRAEAAAAEKNEAQTAVSQLTGISEYFDGIVDRKDAIAAQMRDELDYSAILGELNRLAGKSVQVSAATLQTQPPCQGPNPFEAQPALGCMSITVTASNEQAVLDFVDNINTAGELINSAFAGGSTAAAAGATATAATGSQETEGKSSEAKVNVTFNYVAEALSLRHVPEDQKQQVLSEAIARSVLPPGTLATTPAVPTTPTTPTTPGATQ